MIMKEKEENKIRKILAAFLLGFCYITANHNHMRMHACSDRHLIDDDAGCAHLLGGASSPPE